MIRLISLSVSEFVANWLPTHKRKNIFLQLFTKLAFPFTLMMADWIDYRNKTVTKARVTGETLSLQWYLNELFDNVNRQIVIETAAISGVPAGLEATETDGYIIAGIEASELSSYGAIPLAGEGVTYGTASFAVFVPPALMVQEVEISRIVNIYKSAGKTFKIISL